MFLATEIQLEAKKFIQKLSPLFTKYVSTFSMVGYADSNSFYRILNPEKKSPERHIFMHKYF